MAYETFYRKYRSKTFSEIVGQDHIKQTLSNAIKNDRLSHAYIFSGPRGTGKTSTARILAKSLNCREGKGVTPCLKCDICMNIASGNAVDVIEIDAASNTGVDNIRELNEKINFMPVECTYKMYIIDEVHMLSTGAFNALLKTLEEPPQNTVFILATTEPHKIPVTIHSRCQQLHFRSLTLGEITEQLKMIAEKESITIDDKSVKAVARNAGGCMRDALSLFNQIYSFKGNDVSYDDVLFILGSTEDQYLITFLGQLFANKESEAMAQLQRFIADGANVTQLIADILSMLRRLMLVKVGLEDEIDTDELSLGELKKLADAVSLDQVKNYLDTMAQTELDLRWFSKPELLLQIRCLKVMQSPQAVAPASPVVAPQAAAPPVQTQATSRPTPPVATPRPTVASQPAPTSSPAPAPVQQAAPQPVVQATANASDKELWDKVVDKLKENKSTLYGVLRASHLINRGATDITVGLKQDFKFFREKLNEQTSKDALQTVINDVFGQRLVFKLPGDEAPPAIVVNESGSGIAMPTQNTQDQRINDIVTMFEGAIV